MVVLGAERKVVAIRARWKARVAGTGVGRREILPLPPHRVSVPTRKRELRTWMPKRGR